MDTQNRERGTQLLELAIVLPLLCLIIFAIIDGADFVRTHVLLNNAAREGARMSASNYCPGCNAKVTTAFIQNYVLEYVSNETSGKGVGPNGKDGWCSAAALSAKNITVNSNTPYAYNDPSTGLTITGTASAVTINYPYTFCYVPNFAASFGGVDPTVGLHTEATFHNLY